jgi:hypothetical protein
MGLQSCANRLFRGLMIRASLYLHSLSASRTPASLFDHGNMTHEQRNPHIQ